VTQIVRRGGEIGVPGPNPSNCSRYFPEPNRLEHDLNGKLLYSWGTYGSFPGQFWGVHQFAVDSAGNVYAAETFGGRTQKFRPKKGADPATLIGQRGKVPES
jgi:hypothetical protein